jgi:Leucine-rich repeat (LRR) protein
MSQLKSLILGRSQFTGAGLKELRSLKLTTLAVMPVVNDDDMVHLREMSSLVHLTLSDTNIGNEGLEHLQHLPLQYLFLNNTKVSDAGLIHLKRMTSLGVLDLRNTDVSEEGLKHLEGLTFLRTLNLDGTVVKDADLKHFKSLTRLTSLTLGNTPVTAKGKADLQDTLGAKCDIKIDPTPTSPDRLVAMKVLGLGGRLRVTEAGKERAVGELAELRQTPFQVIEIDLNKSKYVNDVYLRWLRHCDQLTVLRLVGTPVTNEGLKHLKGLKNLTHLYLHGSQVTPEGRAELKQALPKLIIDD